MALPIHSGPWPLIQFRIHFSETVGLLGRVISPSQGRHLHRDQYKHRKNTHIGIYVLSRVPTQVPSVRASEDSSYPRPRGYCDRLASERAKTVHALDRAATVTG
jgi:hypothetical protein